MRSQVVSATPSFPGQFSVDRELEARLQILDLLQIYAHGTGLLAGGNVVSWFAERCDAETQAQLAAFRERNGAADHVSEGKPMTQIPKDGLWFASVGGNPTEVVRISGGQMYSIGCADPHPLDGIELIEMITKDDMPLSVKRQAAQDRAFRAAATREFKRTGFSRGYRAFP